MEAPKWSSFQSIVDRALNLVSLCDLDQGLLKEVVPGNQGLTLLDLKNRCPEYTSVTPTHQDSSGFCSKS